MGLANWIGLWVVGAWQNGCVPQAFASFASVMMVANSQTNYWCHRFAAIDGRAIWCICICLMGWFKCSLEWVGSGPLKTYTHCFSYCGIPSQTILSWWELHAHLSPCGASTNSQTITQGLWPCLSKQNCWGIALLVGLQWLLREKASRCMWLQNPLCNRQDLCLLAMHIRNRPYRRLFTDRSWTCSLTWMDSPGLARIVLVILF